jgi:hypothetical protein
MLNITCDNCRAEAKLKEKHVTLERTLDQLLSNGWLLLRYGKNMQLHFCGTDCLLKFHGGTRKMDDPEEKKKFLDECTRTYKKYKRQDMANDPNVTQDCCPHGKLWSTYCDYC